MKKKKNLKLAARIKELRTKKNLSKIQLATAIGVCAKTIYNWELESKDLKAGYILKLARFFNVTVDYLLGLEEL